MDSFRRIGFFVVASLAVGCSKDDPETVEPVAKPETVIIGCSGAAGAEIDVRTQLVGDGAVYWDKTDEIRLWACEHGTKNFSACVANEPFRFDYYSPSKSRAGFAGNADLSKFDAAKTYDYYAVSPAPAADAVKGTEVTYTIPAVQTGEYDGRYDILTARQENAPALKAGDDNPSVNLKFDHHIHLLKFTIVSNAWEKGRPVRAVELTFPRAVVGQLTVDATDPTVNKLEDKPEGRKVMIKFPAGKERKLGETFYAMIAPTEIGSGETIGMRIIGTLGETSAEIPAAGKSLAGGHTTPVDLKVKEMTTRYVALILTFTVTDKHGGIGENTLGERVNTARVKGLADAISKAAGWSDGCDPNGADLILSVPATGASASYSLYFLPKDENPDYLWQDELMTSGDIEAIIPRQPLEVEYDSPRALIKTQDGWPFARATAPEKQEGQGWSSTLSVPCLFSENFDNSSGEAHFGTDHGAYELDDYSDYTKGWSASFFEVTGREFRMAAYMSSSTTPDPDYRLNHRGRLTTAFLPLKPEVTTAIKVSYRVAGTREEGSTLISRGKYTYATYELGLDTESGTIKGDGTSLAKVCLTESSKNNKDFSYSGNGSYTQKNVTITDCKSSHRVSWRSSFVTDGGTAKTVYIYLDDIKVQLK